MQSQEHSSIAGNTLNPSQTLQIEQQQDQQIPTSSVNYEEVKLDAKSKRQRKPKVKDDTTDLPSDKGSEEKVRKQRQSKKNKETQDGAQVPAHQPPTDVKDESSKKAEKKRKQKEETKSQKKEAQPKIESLFKSQPKLNVQAAASSESDKKPVASIPANVGVDVPMEDIQQAGSVSLEQLNGKKPKREKKTTPQKMEQMLVLPEKVLEWKAKKDQFSSILRDVINQGHQARQKHSNPPPNQLNQGQDQYALSDELRNSLKTNLIRNLSGDQPVNQESSQFKELEIDISKALACLIENSELSLAKLVTLSLEFLKTQLSQEEETDKLLKQITGSIDLSQLILRNAERRSYGVRDWNSTIYECEAQQALWFWEVVNTSHFPTQELQKQVKAERNQRQALQEKVKCLDKMVRLIDKAKEEKDLPKIVEEQEKYNKILRKENAALQQQIERDRQQRDKEQHERQKQEQIQREKEQKEQERILKEQQREQERHQKEQEKLNKEQERLRLLKEKEEQKEKERLEKERQAQEKQKQKEQERIEKQQRMELKRKQEEDAKLEAQNPHPSKQLKTHQPPVQTNTLLSMFSKTPTEPRAAPAVTKQFAEDAKINSQTETHQKKEVFPRPFKLVNPLLKPSQFYESESVKLQKRFRDMFGHSFVTQNEPYPNKSLLRQFFKAYGTLDVASRPKDRKKCIIIEDSFMKYLGVFDKKSAFLDPRNPLMKDETLIDYDMSSEEEWNEQNGEDVNKENQEDDAEDDEIEKMLMEEEQENQSEADFIVPDDYISASELMLSQQEGSQVQQELNQRREAYANRYTKQFNNMNPNLQHYVFLQDSKERGVINYLKEYRAVSFPKTAFFPLRVKAIDDAETGNQDEKNGTAGKLNSKAINSKLAELVKVMHGSFQSKQKIIDDFIQKYPECSRKSIEKKMRDLFEKDKKNDDPRQRWYATESTLIELNLQDDQQLKTVFDERLQEVLEEIRKADEEAMKAKEEKIAIKQQQKQEKIQERMELKEQQKQEAAAAKAEKAQEKANQQQNTLLTPNKQPKLQFKEADSKQKSQFVQIAKTTEEKPQSMQQMMEVDTEQSTANSNNQQPVIAHSSQGLDKLSSEKTTKQEQIPPTNKSSTVKQDQDKHRDLPVAAAKRDQAPKVVLTNFFKKADPAEKEKALQAEQQRTNELVKKQKELETLRKQNEVAVAKIAATIMVDNVEETAGIILKQIKSHDQQMTVNQFTTAINLAGKQTSASPAQDSAKGNTGVHFKIKKVKQDTSEEKKEKETVNSEAPMPKTKSIQKQKRIDQQAQSNPKDPDNQGAISDSNKQPLQSQIKTKVPKLSASKSATPDTIGKQRKPRGQSKAKQVNNQQISEVQPNQEAQV